MKVERFREIKERIKKIVDISLAIEKETIELSNEEIEKVEDELEKLAEEIHNSDLSNISFDEYEDFFDLGFDFNGTGANIDFNIIDLSFNDNKCRYQGCNIRNLDISNINTSLLDDDSFDKEIRDANSKYFAPKKITDSEARKRYYSHNLTLEDLKKYDLKEISTDYLSYLLKPLIDKIGLEKLLSLDEEIVTLVDQSFAFNVTKSDLTFESPIEEINDLLKSVVIEKINDKFLKREQREKLFQSRYVQENLSEYIINFPGNKQELKEKYLKNELDLSDISNNLDLFRGKKFIGALDSSINYEIKTKYQNLTEEQIIYLIDKLPNIFKLFKNYGNEFINAANEIDIEKDPEENKRAIVNFYKKVVEDNSISRYSSKREIADLLVTEMSSYEDLINDPKLDILDYYKKEMLKLVSDPDFSRLEAVEGINVKEIIKSDDQGFFEFFNRYGINTVLDFEEENGPLFTKNNYANIKFINDAYMHYAGNDHDEETSLYYGIKPWDDKNPFYSKEQFEEYIRRMIVYGPTDFNYLEKDKLDYRDLKGPFREKYKEFFLPEDAPIELQDKFYTSIIKIEDIANNPEYIHYLKDADVGISLEYLPFSVDGKYKEGWHLIKEKLGTAENGLNFIVDNSNLINYLKKGNHYSLVNISSDMSIDDVILAFNKEIEDRIINQGLSYGEDAPEYFKANHEDYFLAEDAPEALKKAFYPDKRMKIYGASTIFDKDGINALSKEKDWQKFLIGKNKDITQSILTEFIKGADNKVVKETFLYYLDNDFDIASLLIESMTAEQILQTEVTLPEDKLKKIIEQNPDKTLKALLFSEKVNKEKLLLLSKYKEINNTTNTLDSTLTSIYLDYNSDVESLNKKIDEIYNLFTYDNVPEFLKTYKLFELGNFASVNNDRIQSYNGVDDKTKNKIILSDLFRISLDSNNKSLKDFAKIMKYGDEILAKVTSNGELDLDNLSKEENAIFGQYVDTLITMHNISVRNSEDKKTIEVTHDSKIDLKNLQQQYENGEKNVFSSKILAGLFNGEVTTEVTPDSILQYMDIKSTQRSKKAQENSKMIENGNLNLESGDFIKGIRNFESYLKSMLRYGLKGGEFNREFSHSDATPLDLDFGYISDANFVEGQESDYDVISTTISHGYGNTYIVLKDYGRKFDSEEQSKDDKPIKFSREPEYWTNHPDNNTKAKDKDRYIRTGVGALDIDYIVSKEWKKSFGYEMAMAGLYIPVKNEKGELVFSYDDYKSIREQMKGLSYYESDPFVVNEKATKIGGLYEIYRNLDGEEEKVKACEEILEGKEDSVTATKKNATLEFLKGFFRPKGIHVVDNLSSDLSVDEVELIDTGSTGRGTNVPGDGDFDFMLRHNLPQETIQGLQSYACSIENKSSITVGDGFRIKEAVLPEGEKVDIDVTYAPKDLSLEYSSDMSIKDRLNSIREANPEEYNYVRTNIIMAKNILKKMGIYKKINSDGATEYGGFGGIGVENWILQNGGSFEHAIDTYLEATKDEQGNDLSYQEFIENYPIYDFGNNHREGRTLHDRFSAFLGNSSDSDGHKKAFEFVKETFRGIQRDLRLYQEVKESENISEERILEIEDKQRNVEEDKSVTDSNVSVLRQSISVEALREESQNKFVEFCKENFILMSKLIAKYSKTRNASPKITDEQSKDEGVSI